jgi:hypothetical protein
MDSIPPSGKSPPKDSAGQLPESRTDKKSAPIEAKLLESELLKLQASGKTQISASGDATLASTDQSGANNVLKSDARSRANSGGSHGSDENDDKPNDNEQRKNEGDENSDDGDRTIGEFGGVVPQLQSTPNKLENDTPPTSEYGSDDDRNSYTVMISDMVRMTRKAKEVPTLSLFAEKQYLKSGELERDLARQANAAQFDDISFFDTLIMRVTSVASEAKKMRKEKLLGVRFRMLEAKRENLRLETLARQRKRTELDRQLKVKKAEARQKREKEFEEQRAKKMHAKTASVAAESLAEKPRPPSPLGRRLSRSGSREEQRTHGELNRAMREAYDATNLTDEEPVWKIADKERFNARSKEFERQHEADEQGKRHEFEAQMKRKQEQMEFERIKRLEQHDREKMEREKFEKETADFEKRLLILDPRDTAIRKSPIEKFYRREFSDEEEERKKSQYGPDAKILSRIELPKYWGKADRKHSAYQYMQIIEDYAKSYGIDPFEIAKAKLPFSLKQDARGWYDFKFHRIRSWTEFQTEFLSEFAACNYFRDLKRELDHRTQHEDESMTQFVQKIYGYYKILGELEDEAEICDRVMSQLNGKCEILSQGQRFYSLNSLERFARDIDQRMDRIETHKNPPKLHESVEKHLAFHGVFDFKQRDRSSSGSRYARPSGTLSYKQERNDSSDRSAIARYGERTERGRSKERRDSEQRQHTYRNNSRDGDYRRNGDYHRRESTDRRRDESARRGDGYQNRNYNDRHPRNDSRDRNEKRDERAYEKRTSFNTKKSDETNRGGKPHRDLTPGRKSGNF